MARAGRLPVRARSPTEAQCSTVWGWMSEEVARSADGITRPVVHLIHGVSQEVGLRSPARAPEARDCVRRACQAVHGPRCSEPRPSISR
jgi:hypothetical protein